MLEAYYPCLASLVFSPLPLEKTAEASIDPKCCHVYPQKKKIFLFCSLHSPSILPCSIMASFSMNENAKRCCCCSRSSCSNCCLLFCFVPPFNRCDGTSTGDFAVNVTEEGDETPKRTNVKCLTVRKKKECIFRGVHLVNPSSFLENNKKQGQTVRQTGFFFRNFSVSLVKGIY